MDHITSSPVNSKIGILLTKFEGHGIAITFLLLVQQKALLTWNDLEAKLLLHITAVFEMFKQTTKTPPACLFPCIITLWRGGGGGISTL